MTAQNMIMTNDTYGAAANAAFGSTLNGGGGDLGLDFISALPVTIETRISRATQTSTEVFISQRGTFWLGMKLGGTLQLNYFTAGGELTETGTAITDDGATHHIALALTDAGVSVYVDGVLDISAPNGVVLEGTDPEGFLVREGFAGSASFSFEGVVDELTFWDSEKYTSPFTPMAVPYSGAESGLTHLYHLDGNGDDSVGAIVGAQIAPNDPAFIYSPYNWKVDGVTAKSINAGAYFRVLYKSTTCLLKFNLGGIANPLPRVVIRLDGRVIQNETLNSTVVVSALTDQDSEDTHLLEVIVEATSETNNRWDTQSTAVLFTGLALDLTGTVSKPVARPKTTLVYGDSITEGVKSLGSSRVDVANNSAIACYPLVVGERTNSEIGVVGFGAVGITVSGQGNVPKLPDSYQYLWSGESRDFGVNPDVCFWLHGQNDSSNDTVPDGLASINGMLVAMPSTKFVLIRPLSGRQAANLQTIANTCDEPSRVSYKDSAGFWNDSDSADDIHPYGYAHLDGIASGISAIINEALEGGGYSGPTSTANITITGIPDGTYRTILVSTGGKAVLDQELTYTSGASSASGLEVAPLDDLIGAVVDNNSVHLKGAVVSVASS